MLVCILGFSLNGLYLFYLLSSVPFTQSSSTLHDSPVHIRSHSDNRSHRTHGHTAHQYLTFTHLIHSYREQQVSSQGHTGGAGDQTSIQRGHRDTVNGPQRKESLQLIHRDCEKMNSHETLRSHDIILWLWKYQTLTHSKGQYREMKKPEQSVREMAKGWSRLCLLWFWGVIWCQNMP